MTISEIIKELTYFSGTFPHEAIKEAIRQREEITPELLKLLEDAIANIEGIAPQGDYTGHIFAMYLLAQFREVRAYPVIAGFFSADQKLVEQATGDIITEDLGRLLASVCGGDTSLIYAMIENAELDEYVRSAALTALVVLVAQGIKTRDEVIAYFRSLYHEKLEREPSLVWGSLVANSCDLYAGDVMEEIEQSYDLDLVDPTFIDLPYVKRHLGTDVDTALAKLASDSHYQFIDDTEKELMSWACFAGERRPTDYKQFDNSRLSSIQPQPEQASAPAMKGRNRNAPCPCGSGKKYKKCCGANK